MLSAHKRWILGGGIFILAVGVVFRVYSRQQPRSLDQLAEIEDSASQTSAQSANLSPLNCEVDERIVVDTLNHLGPVWSVALISNGLVSGGGGVNTVWTLDPQTKRSRVLTGHSGWIYEVAVSPDGQTLASASADKTIKLWNLQTGELILTLTEHRGSVWTVAISPDGQTLASGGGEGDRTIKLWNLQTGELIRTLSGHTDWVLSVEIGSSGDIISGSKDQTIRFWGCRASS